MTTSRSATVVVARTARPGRDDDAERWLQRLIALAAKAPGHLGAELQRPGPEHPGEWVAVYEFADRDLLAGWLSSPERVEMRATEAEVFVGDAREQILATSDRHRAVTAVSSFRLRRADDDRTARRLAAEFEEAFDRLLDALRRFDGFISVDRFDPEPGVQDDLIIVFSFATRGQLDVWFDSVERADALSGIDPLLADPRTTNVVGGFAGWFTPGDRPTPTWKQATLVLAALYPTALVIGSIRDTIAPDLPVVLATLIGNAAGVAVLSWLLMPPLTRRFQRWLTR
ncbi:MAG: antibiotic biosynthesis monooxygenase [Actinomycetota bacterium]